MQGRSELTCGVGGFAKSNEKLESDDADDTDTGKLLMTNIVSQIVYNLQGTDEKHHSNSQFPLPLHLELQQLEDWDCEHPKVHGYGDCGN